jgi:hypothetical protein
MRRVVMFALLAGNAAAQPLLWTRQLGTSANDYGRSLAVDAAGNAYIAGETEGSLGGPNAGSLDSFLTKYDASGIRLWTRQVGTEGQETCYGVAIDGAGNAYISGATEGSLGGPSAGNFDAFLAKYDACGTLLRTRQLGTPGNDRGFGVAVDSAGRVYVTGDTEGDLGGLSAGRKDAFLAKFDASGALLWVRQAGSAADDDGFGVAVDAAGDACVSGSTDGSFFGPSAGNTDIFLAKFDASGILLWTRQAGAAGVDFGSRVAMDATENVCITGYVEGTVSEGWDIFLAKYSASGTLLWTRQAGTPRFDGGYGVAVDVADNVHITGSTGGGFGGASAGGHDAFLATYDNLGALIWTRQEGTTTTDAGFDLAVDGAGDAYITGFTNGSFGGPGAGGYDVFLSKYGPSPCLANLDRGGAVDLSDLSILLAHFGTPSGATYADGDITGDGVVDLSDLMQLLAGFGTACP